jgi:hypothetical protein
MEHDKYENDPAVPPREQVDSSQSDHLDRRTALTNALKYSAPLIAALIPDKAKAFSF